MAVVGDPVVNTVIAETADFKLVITHLRLVPEHMTGARGYALVNKRTGVNEQEGNSEAHAIRALHASQQYLNDVLKDPEGAGLHMPALPGGGVVMDEILADLDDFDPESA